MKTRKEIVAETETTKVLKVWVEPTSEQEAEQLASDDTSILGAIIRKLRESFFESEIKSFPEDGDIEIHQEPEDPNSMVVFWTKK